MDPRTSQCSNFSKRGRLLKLVRQAIQLNCVWLVLFAAAQAQEPQSKTQPENLSANSATPSAQRIVEQGISVEFTVNPHQDRLPRPRAGEDSIIKFKISDTTSGTPVKGLNLSAWISLRATDKPPDNKQCRERIQSFLGGSLRERPDVDLNSYYILALNQSPDISVIDPLLSFGGSKLLTLVMLKSPGEDWVLTQDGERLFVSLPASNQVAAVETRTWKVIGYIDTGVNPKRVALQSDQNYLWVANDGDKEDTAGVTVIDAATLKVAAQVVTGLGHKEVVIDAGNRFAYVSNAGSGTVSVIDVRKLQKINDIKIGPMPVSVAISELSKDIYVASEAEGNISVIDGQTQEVVTRMNAKPGVRSIRFAPGGRYGFALNTRESTVNIFDSASSRMLHEVKVGKAPDQIIFSSTFAFVRSLNTESVNMIRLATIGKEIDMTEFPGGQNAPQNASPPAQADSMVLAPEGNSVIVANPADKVIYYYTEGMAAPMGDFQNYRREPRGVLVVDRGLRETSPGVYSAIAKLPASGKYDVAFLADSPRIAHCFEAVADANPLQKPEQRVALRVEHQIKEMNLPVGQNFRLRFKLIDTATEKPKADLKDVKVLTLLAAGTWQRRDLARSIGDGLYELDLNVPQPGFYMIFVESASMRVQFRDMPYLMLQAIAKDAAAAQQAGPTHVP